MKISKSFCRLVWGLTLVVTLAYPPGVPAAEQPPVATGKDTAEAKTRGYDLEIVDGRLVRPGRNVEPALANVVDALRDQYPEANIIVAPGLARLTVGDLKLRSGRLAEELEAVRVASGDKFEVQAPSGPNPPIDPNTGLPIAATRLNTGLFVLRGAKPTPEAQRIVEAFNVGPYLDWSSHQNATNHPSEDEILREVQSMISDTLEAFETQADQGGPPTFQYHRGATMLVIIGNIESVEIARKIVNALPGMNAVADSSRARYGFEPPRDPAAEDRAARQAAADSAFRKRYGLTRPVRSEPESGTAVPQPVPQK